MICLLCQVLLGDPRVPFRRFFSPDDVSTEVLRARKHAAVISDVAPIVEGHVLVVGTAHQPGFFSLGSEQRLAVWSLTEEICADVREAFGAAAVAEHGAGRFLRGDGGPCIEHLHIHILPFDYRVLLKASQYRVRFEETDPLTTPVPKEDYLLLGDGKDVVLMAQGFPMERQHWRRVAASVGGEERRDWRQCLWGTEARRTREFLARTRFLLGR